MFRFAFRNLLSRKTRTLLSLLGLTVAIMGMVGLFSVAEGLDQLVSRTFDRIPGLIAMQPGAPIPLFSKLPAEWKAELEDIEGVRTVNPEIWERVNVIEGKMIVSPPRFFFGTEIASRLALERDPYREDIVSGRFLRPDDRGTLNCVISRPIAEEFGSDVGDKLEVNGHVLNIVGIYECGTLLLDVAIILDIGVVRELNRFDDDSVSAFYIEQTGTVGDDELAERIHDQFRGRQRGPAPLSFNPLVEAFRSLDRQLKSAAPPVAAPPKRRPTRPSVDGTNGWDGPQVSPPKKSEQPSAIEVRSSSDWMNQFDRLTADLDLVLAILTSIGVTIAVLSILNTMMMSVSERMIEFGILKANGWSRGDVLKLVMLESGLIGIGGGMLGSGLGWAATHALNARWPDRLHLFASPGLLAFAVAFSTFVGVLGGFYPAWSAMRLMPMDAIRRG
ncbi:MAG: ABC transporter permease [Planctomycetes bacterium]|nr:ABC transporter permease [Planctomycetota bacterium]